jgi:hypothetical protein
MNYQDHLQKELLYENDIKIKLPRLSVATRYALNNKASCVK